MYTLLQVLHLSLYIPLRFLLIGFSVSCWCIVFVVRRAMFKLVCLKRLVIFRISRLLYVNVIHFLVCCVVFERFFLCCLVLSFFLQSV
jgi:hypothetical protein